MNKILHGIDLCQINRHEFENEKLLKRFLHTSEYQELQQIDNSLQRQRWIASHWAIKEATFKALQTKCPLSHICIKYQNNTPIIQLNDYQSVISISYENDLVIASVILYS